MSKKTLTTVQTAAGQIKLTPAQVSGMRGAIATTVNKHLETAEAVLAGKKEWTPTQARVFSTLINKVIPDLSASYTKHEHEVKDLQKMSREELQAVAQLGVRVQTSNNDTDDSQPIDADYAEIDPEETL